MSKRKKHRAPDFVMVRKDLLKDPKWKKLSNKAKIVYIYMRGKFNKETLSKITLTYSEMKDVMKPKPMSRAIKELIKDEWIEKVEQGGLLGGKSVYTFLGEYRHYFYKGFKI